MGAIDAGAIDTGAIDTSAIDTEMPEITATIERGRLRSFAQAVGETDAVYSDLEAARAAHQPHHAGPVRTGLR